MIKSLKDLMFIPSLVTPIAIAVFLCASCNDGEKGNQKVLERDQMIKILTEVYLTEQKVNRLGLPRDSAEHEFERFKKIVFEKKGISDSVFKKSFDYYMDHPKEMELIYTAVVDSLSLMEQRSDSTAK